MGIDIQTSGKTARVTLSGELTIYTVAEIKTALLETMEVANELEVDLSDVSEVDTAGIQLMLIAKRKAGKKVVFNKHPPAVLRLVELASLGSALGDLMVIDAAHT